MNRKHKNFIGMLVGVLALLSTLSFPCFAEGTTTIHMSADSLSVGDTLSVTVTASESGSISLRYNADVLQFAGSSASYTTDGNTITFEGTSATLQFTAASQGQSSLIVSSPTITGSSASVQVARGTGDMNTQQTQDTQDTATQAADGQFVIDGVAYVVSERYPESAIPAGFSRTRVTIDGYAYRELSNGSITLLYLKRADNTAGDGVFYQYDEAMNTVTPFTMLGTAEQYVVLATPDSLLRDSFTETTLTVGDQTLSVYKEGDDSDFYFVYGTNQDGVTGWFQYDNTDGSLQRVNEDLLSQDTTAEEPVTTAAGSDEYFGKWQKQRYLVAILLFVIVVLAVVIINLLLSRRRREEEEDWMDEDELNDPDLAGAEDEAIEEDLMDDPAEDEDADQGAEKTSIFVKLRRNLREEEEDEFDDLEDDLFEDDLTDMEAEETQPEIETTEEAPEVKRETAGKAASEDALQAQPNKNRQTAPQEPIYSDIKGTEAFQSKENTRYKGADLDAQLDILDLNDL